MCGITGFLQIGSSASASDPSRILKQMTSAMTHRGPDGDGFLQQQPVFLGMRRLRVIDLETGAQPIFNEDKSIAVVFNGEIYNYLELREELQNKGHGFTTQSDTEVLVHLYEEEGVNFPARLRGMFAFCIYDQKKQQIVLGRDCFGIKPLYWSRTADCFVFASEIKSLQQHPALKWNLNEKALDDFLTLLFIPGPATAFNNVFKLEPGCVMTVNFNGAVKKHRYWDPREQMAKHPTKLSSLGEIKERLDTKLQECVRLALRSDVPLGCFLSSGLDSSTMVYYASKLQKDLRTFTIYYEDKSYSEREGAACISRHFQARHTEFPLEFPSDIPSFISKVLSQFDQPFGDLSSLPTYLLCSETRKHVTVSLSGDGGDELFGGYPTAIATRAFDLYKHAPSSIRNVVMPALARILPTNFNRVSSDYKIKRFIQGSIGLDNSLAANFSWRGAFTWRERKEFYNSDFFERVHQEPYASALKAMRNVEGLSLIDQTAMGDLNVYLPDLYLIKADMTSMVHSLELRPAFLDPELAQLAFQIPFSLKIRGLQTKWILRELMKERLPQSILKLPKQGFTPPLAIWLTEKRFQDFVRDITRASCFARLNILKPEKIDMLLSEHQEKKVDHTRRLWAIIALAIFSQRLPQLEQGRI